MFNILPELIKERDDLLRKMLGPQHAGRRDHKYTRKRADPVKNAKRRAMQQASRKRNRQ